MLDKFLLPSHVQLDKILLPSHVHHFQNVPASCERSCTEHLKILFLRIAKRSTSYSIRFFVDCLEGKFHAWESETR